MLTTVSLVNGYIYSCSTFTVNYCTIRTQKQFFFQVFINYILLFYQFALNFHIH